MSEEPKLIAAWAYDASKQASALLETLTAEPRHGERSITDVLGDAAEAAAWSRFLALRDQYAEEDAPMRAELLQSLRKTESPEQKRDIRSRWRMCCYRRRLSAIDAAQHSGYPPQIYRWTDKHGLRRWEVDFASGPYVRDFIERLYQIKDACAASASGTRGPGRPRKNTSEWKPKITELQAKLAEIDLEEYRLSYEARGKYPEEGEFKPAMPKQIADELGVTERGILKARGSAGYRDKFEKGVQALMVRDLENRLDRKARAHSEEIKRKRALDSETARGPETPSER